MRIQIPSIVKKAVVGGAAAALLSSGAYAAVDGTLGATSTGSVDISLTVNGAVKISNLADITLPAFSGADVGQSQTACVYSNSTGGVYTITATATGGSFDLLNGANSIPYVVEYDDQSGGGAATLTHGTSATMAGASGTDDDCGGSGSNATIQIDVTAADASAVPQGTYTSTLTLVVAPI